MWYIKIEYIVLHKAFTTHVRMHTYATKNPKHYNDVMMGDIASQITSLAIVYSTVYSGTGQRKHQSSASLAFVRGIHRRPVISPHKWPVTRKRFSFDDVIMSTKFSQNYMGREASQARKQVCSPSWWHPTLPWPSLSQWTGTINLEHWWVINGFDWSTF